MYLYITYATGQHKLDERCKALLIETQYVSSLSNRFLICEIQIFFDNGRCGQCALKSITRFIAAFFFSPFHFKNREFVFRNKSTPIAKYYVFRLKNIITFRLSDWSVHEIDGGNNWVCELRFPKAGYNLFISCWITF